MYSIWCWRGRGGQKAYLDVAVDGELAGGQSANHEQTSADASVAATETELLGDLDQSAGGALAWETLCLVDLGKHGIGGLRNEGGSETGDEARSQVDRGLCTVRRRVLVNHVLPDGLGNLLVDDEFGHGVRDLLEQDGTEAAVEGAHTLGSQNFAEARHETGREGGFRDQSDTGGLEGAEGNIGEEFGGGGGGEVDGGSVVLCSVVAEEIDGLLLEELVTAELEGALEEVPGKGRANTGQKSTRTFICNDFPEATDHASVVCDGVELDSGLDAGDCQRVRRSAGRSGGEMRQRNLHVDWSETAMGDGAADCTSEGLDELVGEWETKDEADFRLTNLL